ncbi:hypothetical protein GCM10007860_28670 [Chitiniphilus shinanonensis]|uniref:diguanylate cyclase n=1 Tax=Chitiniphilus shinanonensis TaxID=553088 RepID=A0ABQ6BUP7_9NEIS|nr:GGDEF domain-containing protein [Chitiniphilus shinanonensis]GLS05710.1 hypothetical protein GCM10007860_28670 [Chitiniphilus shinanonensis]
MWPSSPLLSVALVLGIPTLLSVISLTLLALGHRERGQHMLAAGALSALGACCALALDMERLALALWLGADTLLLIGGRHYLGQAPRYLTTLPWPTLAFAIFLYSDAAPGSALHILALALAILPLAPMHVGSLIPNVVEERWAAPRQLFAVAHILHAAYWLAVALAWLTGAPGAWARLPVAYLPLGLMVLIAGLAWPQLVGQRLRSRISRLARFDALTGALNRRGVEEIALRELHRVRRHQGQLGLVLVDLDRFRTLNARYGHGAGDVALRTCADAIREQMGRGEYFGRVGGEEFCILAPGLAGEALEQLLTKVRQAVRELEVEHEELLIRFSASASMAGYGVDGSDFDTLYRVAMKRISQEKKGPIAFADTAPQAAAA